MIRHPNWAWQVVLRAREADAGRVYCPERQHKWGAFGVGGSARLLRETEPYLLGEERLSSTWEWAPVGHPCTLLARPIELSDGLQTRSQSSNWSNAHCKWGYWQIAEHLKGDQLGKYFTHNCTDYAQESISTITTCSILLNKYTEEIHLLCIFY